MEQNNVIINLDSLLDLSAKLNEADDELFILNSAVLSIMGKLRVIRSAVFLPEHNKFKCAFYKGKNDIDEFEAFNLSFFSEIFDDSKPQKLLLDAGYKYISPLKYKNETLAVIALGVGVLPGDFSDEEIQYANLVCTITANALQIARSHFGLIESKNRVEQKNQILANLFEIGRDFSNLLSREQIIKMLSFHLMGQLMVSRYAVLLQNHNNEYDTIINRFDALPADVIDCAKKCDSAVYLNCAEKCSEYIHASMQNSGIEVISPMIVQGNRKGLLIVGKSLGGKHFDETNLQFVTALGNTAMSALENERLFHEELEKKKMENELELALDIQKNLLPKENPNAAGFDIAGLSFPSRHVGGDYFDYISLSDTEILIAIADVSGKGMPASLIMANLQAALRVIAPLRLSLEDLVQRLNKIVYLNTSSDKFVTFFCGVLNTFKREFTYINAGHNPPLFLSKDNICLLDKGGLILGVLDEMIKYEIETISLEDNDIMLFYTDGVSEALNGDMEEFGELSIKEILTDKKHLTSAEIIENIVTNVKSHSGDGNQTDDITLIAVKTLAHKL